MYYTHAKMSKFVEIGLPTLYDIFFILKNSLIVPL